MSNLIVPLFKGNPGGLTNDQYRAAQDIEVWYKSKELIYTLYGAAGTGKTYLLNYLLKNVFIHSTCVTAPTHKAVKVVENVTGRKGKTLQSLHGLRPNVNLEDFDVDKIKFDSLGNDTIKNYALVIIDEASQVNLSLHKLNVQRANQYKVKILYVGDFAQLSPINERQSQVFSIPRRFELIEVVRQKESNPLLNLFECLREDIYHGGNRFMNQINKVPTSVNKLGEGYICVDLKTFQKEIVEIFKSKEFEGSPQNYVRYAAWTNESVNIWNTFIRNSTLKHAEEILSVEDLIVGYKTIVDEFNNPVIINSEDYIIEDLHKRISDDGFEVFVTSFRSLIDGRSTTVFVVNHKSDTFGIYTRRIAELRFNALYSNAVNRGKNWRRYFEYKDKFLTLQPFVVRDSDGKETTVPKDLDYGYGLTIHKLQGSTINHVFVNMLDICYYRGDKESPIVNTRNNPNAIELRNKLIYTSLSRAKKIAIILV